MCADAARASYGAAARPRTGRMAGSSQQPGCAGSAARSATRPACGIWTTSISSHGIVVR